MPAYIKLNTDLISDMYKSGKTSKEIAAFFNVSNPTIRRRIRKLGIQRGPKYPTNHDAFSTLTTESCYWAGFLAADAWVGSEYKKKKLILELASKDKSHLVKFCNFLERDSASIRDQVRERSLRGGKIKKYYSSILEVGGKPLVRDLVNNFNVIQRKTFTLKPPPLKNEFEIRAYIRGFFDGDGHIGRKKYCTFNIVSASPEMLKWTSAMFVRYINIEPKIYKCKDEDKNAFSLQTSSTKAEAILSWLYKDSTTKTRLDRKHKRYLRYQNKLGA